MRFCDVMDLAFSTQRSNSACTRQAARAARRRAHRRRWLSASTDRYRYRHASVDGHTTYAAAPNNPSDRAACDRRDDACARTTSATIPSCLPALCSRCLLACGRRYDTRACMQEANGRSIGRPLSLGTCWTVPSCRFL